MLLESSLSWFYLQRLPGKPTFTDLIEMPAFSSAWEMADLIAVAAASISTIIPSLHLYFWHYSRQLHLIHHFSARPQAP